MPVMPKGRYRIMTNYMPKVGKLGLDMMYRTCTVQANLDFSSEADMVKKLRVSLALQPVATALFANSPFTEGKPNGFLSFRSQIWTDTDADRSGMLPWAFEDGMGFERWVDYALDVPMYFIKRGDKYIDVAGKSFRDFFAGKLDALPGERPTISDWANHLSTIFPEVRLKRYLEMRGDDGGPWRRLPSLAAFWVGLLYDDDALDACWDMVKGWTAAERQKLRDDVPRLGFARRDPRPQRAHAGAGDAALCHARAGAAQISRPQRPRRDALSAAAGREHRARHHAGGGIAGEIPRAVERLGRTDFRGIRVLTRDPMAKATPATLALEKAGVAFKLHEYDYDPNADAHRHAGRGSARHRAGAAAQDADGAGRGCGRVRAGAVRPRGEPEEARAGRRRQKRRHARRRGGRA